jgi:large subunit ribosomal protein L11
MAKKVSVVLRLQLQAGKATAANPVGPALGPHSINILAFLKEYNEKTAHQAGTIVPAEVTIYSDRSFALRLLTPPAAELLRRAAGIEKGAGATGRSVAGRITCKQLREIALVKLADLNALDVEAAERVIAGTARSMGIEIVGEC